VNGATWHRDPERSTMMSSTLLDLQAHHLIEERITPRRRPGLRRHHRPARWIGGR
jgi:hypothetical protein